ncbi:PLP-dependent aminotransferase family protein [Nocardioides zeae]|uniref:PLP-dependent aminotransferase family protein n=1 Tax=Nocardioides imazamoxiresistens TaxID=3231893 RepID=A0ABU3PV83_9ACTN|nr:PLP-dependent aminotransferase family protein [Nocardioides zeae]MDT9593147.1 PLP-dependent aminotransferase family protein [Nocardioides zeae]
MHDSSSARIAADLRAWVATAAPGARLPSTRSLVAEHQVSPVTVQQALRALDAEGLVETRPGVGTFVRAVRTARPVDHGWQTAALRSAETRPLPPPSPPLRHLPNDVISLHSGYPDRDLLPERLVRAALGRAARGDAALGRAPASGLPALQSWFARELGAATPVGVSPVAASDVVVLPGSQSGLGSIFRSLIGAGRPLLVESPTYWGAIVAARTAGVRLVPVPTGPHGVDPDELARAFEETGARLFYAQPSYANPTGAQWPPELQRAVLEVVRGHGAFLVEDDWAHDFGITTSASPVAALDEAGHVIYVRSLTKSVSPALRVAAAIARGPVRDRILADRAAEGMYVSGLLQSAALEVVTDPGWRTHLRGLREQLRSRRDLLVASLREHAPQVSVEHVPAGGLNLWARLPRGTDVARLVDDCERLGLVVAPGSAWYPAEDAAPHVRLSFAGSDPSAYPRAARLLAQALGDHAAA